VNDYVDVDVYVYVHDLSPFRIADLDLDDLIRCAFAALTPCRYDFPTL